MEKNALWKWIALGGMTLWSIILMSDGIKKGLDIQGGSSFEVQLDADALRAQMKSEAEYETDEKLDAAVAKRLHDSRDTVVERIRNRIDGIGVAEPSIFPRAEDRIVVQLPGIDSNKTADARASIESVAFLAFRLVHENSQVWVQELFAKKLAPRGFKVGGDDKNTFYIRDLQAVPNEKADRAFWSDIRTFARRPGCEFLLTKDDLNGATIYRPHYVEVRRQLDGTAVKNARVELGQMGEHRISLTFNSKGASQFARVTSDYAPNGERNIGKEGRQLGIVLDDTLYSAPVIRGAILNGSAEITGSFTALEAARLVNVLHAGSLPVPVKIISSSEVSPTMGKNAVSSGVNAAVTGSLGVILFMMFYYRLAGTVQNIALLLIVLLLPFGAWISAGVLGILAGGEGGSVKLPVLTMPGIAGIALTIGMAVDAAVLIFERMREELTAGKSLKASIDAGYERAFSAILDSNVTTVITAVILFWQGTGPIRGFAVMLCAGIIVSMIVYLIYMRLFLETMAERTHVKTFKFLHVIRGANYNFLAKTRIAVIATIIVLAVSWFALYSRGRNAFNVEFLGGAQITFAGLDATKAPVGSVEDELKKAGIEGVVQYEGSMLSIRVPDERGEAAKSIVMEKFKDAGVQPGESVHIGAQVGKELTRSGLMALIFAIGGILLYLTVRFQFAFAVGAIVALLHDAFITVGLYAACGHQFSLAFISALLAMMGYAVNDTIIVFDRIREELKLQGSRMSYRDVCNRAINLTLSRTIITHGVTLISVTALLVLGTGVVKDIALTMFLGIVTGTFSSIFIATPIMLLWHREKDASGSQPAKIAATAKAKA